LSAIEACAACRAREDVTGCPSCDLDLIDAGAEHRERMLAGRAAHPSDTLLARLPSFRRKLDRAREDVADFLMFSTKPYVAWSGGKDSLVVLALVAEQRPGVTAIWTDDELEHDEQLAYVPRTADRLGARLTVKTGTQEHGGWFRSWSSEPSWREPLPGTIVTRESIRVLAPRWGYDGVALGLRAREAPRRRVYLRTNGTVHEDASGQWRCNPLAGWTTDDVWAAIHHLGLEANPVYDRLAAIEVPRDQQRVGPLPLSPGWIVKDGWPDLYRRLVTRYGNQWPA
jgi:3'-phosphoadenosine 5'-phosphosulfate sulfotransferase (PAPS reductase)/FAD synthetase